MNTKLENVKIYSTNPDIFPLPWASDWGKDSYGLWMAFTYKNIHQNFRWIKPGSFKMGSPESEANRFKNEKEHRVILTQGFWLAETACTQELWQVVMGDNPSHFKGRNLPVECVSWGDCCKFMDVLNAEISDLDLSLPTEAQWEYACRAGTITPFSFGDNITTDQVNYNGGKKSLFREKTIDAKWLPCNDWGLYQMHGNVWEWCGDWYSDDCGPDSVLIDPVGASSGSDRVVRGGSWFNVAWFVRSACRFRFQPDFRVHDVGFRLSRGQKKKAAELLNEVAPSDVAEQSR